MRQPSVGSFLPPAGLLVGLVLSKLLYKDSLTSAEPAAETLSKPLEKSHEEQAGQMAYSVNAHPAHKDMDLDPQNPCTKLGVAM